MAKEIIIVPVDSCPGMSYEISGLGPVDFAPYDGATIDATGLFDSLTDLYNQIDWDSCDDPDGEPQLDNDTIVAITLSEDKLWEDICRAIGNATLADLVFDLLTDMYESDFEPILDISPVSENTVKLKPHDEPEDPIDYARWLGVARLSIVDCLADEFDDEDDEIVLCGTRFDIDIGDPDDEFATLDEDGDDEEDDDYTVLEVDMIA